MRGVLKRLEPLLGFKVKVQEKGGTKLGSMLSNKYIWKGGECGRQDCYPCKQGGDKQEDCFRRNVLYESRCNLCNPGGETGLATLKESRANPSIYVGETSRSLKERSLEHHNDYLKKKEDSHMLKHTTLSHKPDNNNPLFNQYVVGSYKSSLSRQIAEAVRIQLRGGTLNSSGVYNRCKLTRLVVDTDWDKRVWEESWESKKREQAHLDRLVESDMLREEEFSQEEKRKRGQSNLKSKKRKVENESGVVWGEEAIEQEEVSCFLYNQDQVPGERKSTKQSTLRPLRGADWDRWEERREITAMVGELVQEVVKNTVKKGEELSMAREERWASWHRLLDEMDEETEEERRVHYQEWIWEQGGGEAPTKRKRGRPKKVLQPLKNNSRITDFLIRKKTAHGYVREERVWEEKTDDQLEEERRRHERQRMADLNKREWEERGMSPVCFESEQIPDHSEAKLKNCVCGNNVSNAVTLDQRTLSTTLADEICQHNLDEPNTMAIRPVSTFLNFKNDIFSSAMHETNILEDEESKTNTQTISYLAATSKESGTETLPNLNLTQRRYGD